jgi:arylsulfatase A-like enzyme
MNLKQLSRRNINIQNTGLYAMKNRNFNIFLIPALLIFSCDRKESASEIGAPPNIIFILADDLGWRDVGFNGSEYYETPVLDSLARNGIQFNNAYANAPNCAPTRACIMTGMYPQRHGVITVGSSERGDEKARKLVPLENTEILDTSTFSLAEMMKSAGYRTGFFGKWHLGNDPYSGPLANGFDINVGGWERGSPRSYFSPYQNPELRDGPEGEQLTDRLTSEAIDFIQNQKDKDQPFFVYLSYYAVHAPFQAKEEWIEYFRNKEVTDEQNNPVYAAMIKTLDINIGRLVNVLDSIKLTENTILLFYSDNGGSWRATSNSPLRGAKGMLYEGGLRVPCFFYSPKLLGGGQIIEEPIISTDLYPSFAKWAGTTIPSDKLMDGESILPFLNGEKRKKPIFWYMPAYLQASSSKGGFAFRTVPGAAIREGSYKLIRWFEEEHPQLYNLDKDLSEENELSLTDQKSFERLNNALNDWLRETKAFIPAQRNSLFDSAYTHEKYGQIRY